MICIVMSPENKDKIRKRIQEAGAALEGRLPPSPRHPKGRNPYAHISKILISMFGESYTEIDDRHVKAVLQVIDHCEKNPF